MKTPLDVLAYALDTVFAEPRGELARCQCRRIFARVVATEREAALVRTRGQCDECYEREQQARDMEE